tara:strand:+ start:453 stop:641 length:189 start_codon:yes stop_codon:yes gene_type:complete
LSGKKYHPVIILLRIKEINSERRALDNMHVGLLLLIMHVYMFNFEYNNETNNLLNTKVIMKP